MIFSIHKKQIETNLEKTLEKEKDRFQSLLNENYSEHIVKELEYVSKRLKNLMMRRSEGHKIRTRIPNFEEQEPNIAYYSRMEKIRSEGNMIYSIKDKNGTVQDSTENIKYHMSFILTCSRQGSQTDSYNVTFSDTHKKRLLWNSKVYVIKS